MPNTKRRVHKISDAKVFNKYELYRKSVQSTETDVDFFRKTYRELRGRKEPKLFREDFCGTFALSCEWVKQNKNNQSFSVDLDPEPLEYGKKTYLEKLTEHQQKRVHIIEGNVLEEKLPAVDISVAMNFSYFIFRARAQMRQYFLNSFKALKSNGIIILDCFGGSLCQDENEEKTSYPKHTYYWEQESFDPVMNRAKFHIHFRIKGQPKVERVFSYDWRMWTIPEIRDLLEEVGFKKTHVYWEGTTRKGEGDGVFTRTEKGEACQAWIAYIVGEK